MFVLINITFLQFKFQCNFISEEEQEEAYFDRNFYVGKDKITKWSKTNFKNISRTKSINIVKVPAGLKRCAKDISNELDAFLKMIDFSMIDEIVKFTNLYIDQRKTHCKYSRERETACIRLEVNLWHIWVYYIYLQ